MSSAQPPAFLAPVASHGQNVHLGQVDFFLSSISYSSPVPQGTQNWPKFKILALCAFPKGSGTWGQLSHTCLEGRFITHVFPEGMGHSYVPKFSPLQARLKFENFLSMRPQCALPTPLRSWPMSSLALAFPTFAFPANAFPVLAFPALAFPTLAFPVNSRLG